MKIIVIGAGITGVSAAEWLRRDGHAVTLIDRVTPGSAEQTSYGNAGMISRSGVVPVSVPGLIWKAPGMLLDPDSPLYLRWSYLPRLMPWLVRFLWNGRRDKVVEIARGMAGLIGDAPEQHEALARGTPAGRFIRQGDYVQLYPDRKTFEADAFGWGLRRDHGVAWEEWDRARLLERDPELGPGFGFAAAIKGGAWLADPGAFVAELAGHFIREGGSFVQGEVAGITPTADGRAAVTLTGGARREADRVVLAAGAWSGKLAKQLGHEARMEAERGYHVLLKNPSHLPPSPYAYVAAKIVATPMDAGLRLAGVVDLGGLDGPPLKAPVEGIRKRIRQLYPNLRWEGEETWMGRRPSTVDSLPLLGPSPKAPAILFAFGGQHLGLTMGPRLGRMTADMINGRKPNIDIAPYRVDRFDRR
ncbi:MAG TPA: FAD-dependent oxidoreductase [Thermohalobaculum sp.]|nr:FAD-dependent oxidoreductase [Thermohalobaculum sp.]